MEDKLKSFIRDNKEQFDSAKAPDNAWARIEKDLGSSPKTKTVSLKTLWMILGGFVLLFAVIGFTGYKMISTDNSSTNVHYAEIEDNQFQSMQQYYQPLLKSTEQKFVSEVNAPSVMEELTELDEGFVELQTDYLNNDAVNKEMMLKLMKENYELRIKILEMAMDKINANAIPESLTKEKTNEY
jgi:hypothetical protein